MAEDDRFSSYSELTAVYRRGEDYDVRFNLGSTRPDVLLLAPHGGKIEKRTAEIAAGAARTDYSCYIFDGNLKAGNNKRELHIKSERYDVPEAVDALKDAQIVIAIHGRQDRSDPTDTWMGGLDTLSCKVVGDALAEAGFSVRYNPPLFKGTDPENICNRGRTGAGVQLEIPLTERNLFAKDAEREAAFISAIRSAITKLVS